MKLIQPFGDGISLVELANGERKYLCHGIFGEEAVKAFHEREGHRLFVPSNHAGEEIFRHYETKEAADAYWAGVLDMDGWLGFLPTTFDDHLKTSPAHEQLH